MSTGEKLFVVGFVIVANIIGMPIINYHNKAARQRDAAIERLIADGGRGFPKAFVLVARTLPRRRESGQEHVARVCHHSRRRARHSAFGSGRPGGTPAKNVRHLSRTNTSGKPRFGGVFFLCPLLPARHVVFLLVGQGVDRDPQRVEFEARNLVFGLC